MKNSGYERNENDWYIEPPWSVEGLLEVEKNDLSGVIMDPCCGTGNIPNVLRENGFNVIGTDLINRNNKADDIGNFEAMLEKYKPNIVISNPPYNLAKNFVDCALKHTKKSVYVLYRLAFLESAARKNWFKDEVPLSKVIVSSKRITMPPGGKNIKVKGGTVAYAWFKFEHGYKEKPTIDWF